MDLALDILNVLNILKDESIKNQDNMRPIFHKYDMLFLGSKFNVINSIELRHTLESKFNIIVDHDKLLVYLDAICEANNMTIEKMISLEDPGIKAYQIYLW